MTKEQVLALKAWNADEIAIIENSFMMAQRLGKDSVFAGMDNADKVQAEVNLKIQAKAKKAEKAAKEKAEQELLSNAINEALACGYTATEVANIIIKATKDKYNAELDAQIAALQAMKRK